MLKNISLEKKEKQDLGRHVLSFFFPWFGAIFSSPVPFTVLWSLLSCFGMLCLGFYSNCRWCLHLWSHKVYTLSGNSSPARYLSLWLSFLLVSLGPADGATEKSSPFAQFLQGNPGAMHLLCSLSLQCTSALYLSGKQDAHSSWFLMLLMKQLPE